MLLGIGIGLSITSGGQKPPPPNTLIANRGFFQVNGDQMAPAYSFGCDAASFGLTGVAASFAQGSVPVLTAASGSFALTGVAANLVGANPIPANSGSFVETGVSAGLNISMPAAQASFSLTGIAAALSTSGSDAAETTAFLARANAVTALDTTHTNAYKALINGLVSDGIFAKLDILFVFATQSQGVSLLNLVNSTYSASVGASPNFTADRGFKGNSTSGTLISTNYNPSTAGGHFTSSSAHLSGWQVDGTLTNDVSILVGGADPGNAGNLELYPQYTDGGTYMTVLDSPAAFGSGLTPITGWFCGTRTASSGANTGAAYVNGSQYGSNRNSTSSGVPNSNICALGDPGLPSSNYSSYQCGCLSAGGALSSTDVANFYGRLRTYMTAVGVP